MKLHLRLAVIRNEIELLENPEMRKIYEEINFKEKTFQIIDTNVKPISYIVTRDDSLDKQIEYLKAVRSYTQSDKVVKIVPSLKVNFAFTKNEI